MDKGVSQTRMFSIESLKHTRLQNEDFEQKSIKHFCWYHMPISNQASQKY